MNSQSTVKYTAFVGLDWANAKHDICLQAADSDQREFDCFAHQTERIEEWAQALQQRFGGRIAVALELSKGPIVYALQKYDFFVLFPINPSTLAKYRQAFKPSRAKDDPTDAELALDPTHPSSRAVQTAHAAKCADASAVLVGRTAPPAGWG